MILAANPKHSTPLRLDQEVREIDEGLTRAKQRDRFELVQKWAVRPRDVQRAVLDLAPQIVHFSGHGVGEAGLTLEDDHGEAQWVCQVVCVKEQKLVREAVSEFNREAIESRLPIPDRHRPH